MSRPERPTRAEFPRFVAVGTRWEDNDVYGHVNNVVYYSFFDTAVNGLLVEAGVLDLRSSEVVGLVVSNSCDYFASVAFPDSLDVGVRVDHIGRSSVRG
jgi:acyl-CoA thioester hydrolase